MTNGVNRALTWGGILGVGGALVGSWMVVQSHQAERLNAGGWNSRGGGAPEGVGQISERDDEIAIFQEMAEAYEMAMVEALKVAPMNDGVSRGANAASERRSKEGSNGISLYGKSVGVYCGGSWNEGERARNHLSGRRTGGLASTLEVIRADWFAVVDRSGVRRGGRWRSGITGWARQSGWGGAALLGGGAVECGARLEHVRDEGAYWPYSTEEQHGQTGCIAGRMQRGLLPGAVLKIPFFIPLGARPRACRTARDEAQTDVVER